ncbi:MAG: hypothetical protein HOV81_09010 [Kofleriaceae bacterium]|nr:hypothetical protein [Kofleriaceae bacterium]
MAPSVDDNNRYIKVTPLGDGARIAYTVFFGEIPGASARQTIDKDGNGRIDEGEARRFGDDLASQVAAAVDVEIDGKPVRLTWRTVDVGMGSDQVAAGSFSIDMVAYLCGSHGAGAHRIRVRDQFRVPRPGETEVKVEDSPGVTVSRAHVGDADDPSHDFRFVGPGGPLSDEGLEVEYTSAASAPMVGTCGGAAAGEAHGAKAPRWIWIALGGVVAAGVAIVVARRKIKAS